MWVFECHGANVGRGHFQGWFSLSCGFQGLACAKQKATSVSCVNLEFQKSGLQEGRLWSSVPGLTLNTYKGLGLVAGTNKKVQTLSKCTPGFSPHPPYSFAIFF